MIVLAGTAHTGAGAGNRIQLRIDAIKYGLGSVAAAGAAVALLLALARHRLAEEHHTLAKRTQAHTETDAAHRRVTDLFTKAVGQLGHPAAAVRLGALYALERVGQDNPEQRQTVVDVLCAYLRMPFTPVAADRGPSVDDPATRRAGPDSPPPHDGDGVSAGRDPRQELQVRLTAERILTKHLHRVDSADTKGGDWFWQDIDLYLTGAALDDWNMSQCTVRNARFTLAAFTGAAWFKAATFASVEFETGKRSVTLGKRVDPPER
jgi:hypothetical protein